MKSMSGKVVLITGGSRGIGAATAVLFAKAGANVAITYRSNREAAQKVVRTILRSGGDCMAIRVDISSAKQIRRAVSQTMRRFGKIDVLVNNAGIWKHAPILSMSERQWNETIGINLTGTFLFTREVARLMKRGGRIINISSTAGQRGEAEYSHYAASKAGIIAFTKSVAGELARKGIHVNCVAPGWVVTDMSRSAIGRSSARKAIEEAIPRGTIATPQDVAGPIIFLASDFADHLVGATLSVNGGGEMVN